MIPVQVEVLPNQEGRIQKALRKEKGCTIIARKVHGGPHSLLLRNPYAKRYHEAKMGHPVRLPFRHKDLVQNLHHKGGFLPLIAAVLAPIIGGVAGGLIEKEIAGSGLSRFSGKPWWHGSGVASRKKKKPELYSIEKHGNGLYLNPWKGGSGVFQTLMKDVHRKMCKH